MKTKYKKVLRCRGCWWVWENKENKITVFCPKCGRKKDARNRKGWAGRYFKNNPERQKKLEKWNKLHRKETSKKANQNARKSALMLVGNGNVFCLYCGCDDVKILEINHKNGQGNKELQKGKYASKFYWDIIMLRRKTDDLNILCKICNALHYLELKYGKLPFKITYFKSNILR